MKLLVLGHTGMLGNAAHKYFEMQQGYEIETTPLRFGTPQFENELKASNADVIINCIGAIPQKKPSSEDYLNLNIRLPEFLETLGKKIVHPTTDCEFSGNLEPGKTYSKMDKRDVEDEYGKSKASISEKIEKEFKNTKMLRVSIIGHELASHNSLLDWFLQSDGEVKGYTNHFWNGITTLQWAKIAHNLIENWESLPVLNQHGTRDLFSKYEVLAIAKEVYGKDITLLPFEAPTSTNKCLTPDQELPMIKEQLAELKAFYGK